MQSREKRKLEDSTEVGETNEDEGNAPPSPKHRRVLGPSLPPSQGDAPSGGASLAGSDSEEDDFGPSLPPSNDRPVATVDPANDAPAMPQSPRPDVKETRRDQWMLHPPEQSDWATKIDPTKLRNRKFQTGKSARTTGAPQQVDAAWVESPEERMRRLQDEVMGVAASPAKSAKQPHTDGASSSATKSMEEKIRNYKDMTGKSSRLESPAHRKEKEEENDPSMRAFDREKDMALSSRISHAQRREMMDRASDYNSRFTKGSFL